MTFTIFHHVIYTYIRPGSLARFRSFAEVGKTWLQSEHAQRAPTKWRPREEVYGMLFLLLFISFERFIDVFFL